MSLRNGELYVIVSDIRIRNMLSLGAFGNGAGQSLHMFGPSLYVPCKRSPSEKQILILNWIIDHTFSLSLSLSLSLRMINAVLAQSILRSNTISASIAAPIALTQCRLCRRLYSIRIQSLARSWQSTRMIRCPRLHQSGQPTRRPQCCPCLLQSNQPIRPAHTPSQR